MGNIESYENLGNDSAPPSAYDNIFNIPNNKSEIKNEINIDNKNNMIKNEFNPFSNKNKHFLSENDIIYSVKSQNNEDIKIPYKKINKNKTNKLLLKLDIDNKYLNEIEKESLLDIINFIKDFCEIRINKDYVYFNHKNLILERNNKNEYLMKIKSQKLNQLKEKIEKNKKNEEIKKEKISYQNKIENNIKENIEIMQNKNEINIENNIKNNNINEPKKSEEKNNQYL